MPRPATAEPVKSSKRKGTRSVSTLTPSQLARKRANDREAQRAIRARTKEHIERLEQELESLKSAHGRDKLVRELMLRNKELEEQLALIKDKTGVSITSSPYSAAAVYDDNLSAGSGAIPSPEMSPLPSADYSCMPDYSQQYVSLPNSCEAWASAVHNAGIPSNVSSPSSTSLNDDFSSQTYIPTSMPSSMMPNGRNMDGIDTKQVKLEYSEMDSTPGFMAMQHMQQPNYIHQHPSPQQQQSQQQWNMYPMYYSNQMHPRNHVSG